jgi:hypothetical protein
MALSEDGCLQQLNLKCSIDEKIKDIMSAMTSFGSVSIETNPPSVVIKTMKAKQAQIMSVLQLKLSCCIHPSSDKAIMYLSSFFTSSSIALLPRKVCRSEAYSLIAIMSLCIPSTVFDSSESCCRGKERREIHNGFI